MKKTDILLSAIIGEAVAWYFLLAFKELGLLAAKFGIEQRSIYWILPTLFPILAVAGIWIAYIIGRKIKVVFQIAKYFLTGAFVTLVDAGVANFLMLITGIYTGVFYSLFKGISATVAFLTKFFGAKLWVFEKSGKEQRTEEKVIEFGAFIIVSVIGIGINVAAASFIVNMLPPQFGFSSESWANVGVIGAAFASYLWNFFGYKFFVFKK